MSSLIIAGVDGCEGGRDAVALGAALAAPDDAELLLTGVWPETLLPLPLLMGRGSRPLETVEQMLLKTRAEQAPTAITRPLSDLSPARALRRVARDEHARAIALGSAADTPAGRACAGRDARQVIHDAPCAVAIAARGLHEQPFAIGSIVVGIDGGAESDAALDVAARLASQLGARLTAVTAFDDRMPMRFGPFDGGLEYLDWEELVEHQRGVAERVAAEAREHPGVTAAEVRVGDPARELAQAGADADLLVLGSRRWGPISRVVIGSVGHKLLGGAPCSLMVVPRTETDPD